MKNLGKIIFIIFLIEYILNAGVVATVDSKQVSLGEIVTYSLNLTGEDIAKPTLNKLCGYDVISTGSTTNIKSINGVSQTSYTLSYTFMPKTSCTIEPVEVEIDGEKETTKAIDIVVSKTPQKDADFTLTLKSNKKEVFVGEPFELTLFLKQKNSAQAVDSKFVPPSLKGFWVRGEPKQERIQNDDSVTTKVTYTMSPQREGKLDISSAQLRVGYRANSRNSWGGFMPQVKWKSYFSNELSIVSKPLPTGVDLVGNFNISVESSSKEISTNEPLNITIKVTGNGNLEDIKTFKPYIDGVSVFDEKIDIKKGVLSQKIAFVADSDFTIPAFTLKFLNPKTKAIETISTEPIDVKVKNAKPKQELNVKRDETSEKVSTKEVVKKELDVLWVAFAFFVGLSIGVFIMLLKDSKWLSKEKKFNIKDEKLLLVKLLPFKYDQDVKKMVDILENNIYSQEKQEIDKKLLKEIVKRYNLY